MIADADRRGETERSGPVSGAGESGRRWRAASAWGPGLLAAIADTDAGNIVVAAQCGMQWGYRLLPVVLLSIPVLHVVQELAARLGITTGHGPCGLIGKHFGRGWAILAAAMLALVTAATLITELTAVAGIGEIHGVARGISVAMAAALMTLLVLSRSWRRVERIALAIGSLELAFLYLAWRSHPAMVTLARQAIDWHPAGPGFGWAAVALLGAIFSPSMVFYQQSAMTGRFRRWDALRQQRRETLVGAVLTQLLTGAVLVASAAVAQGTGGSRPLDSIADISAMLASALGPVVGQAVFGAGVLAASMVAAIVASLAMLSGTRECFGLHGKPRSPAPVALYLACLAACAWFVWRAPDLVSLTMDIQVATALTLPFIFIAFARLAVIALPPALRLSRPRRLVILTIPALACLLAVMACLAP
ncbi:NRAMP family divalent metal transporter [Burkholderia gladioli]|uniref:NRAMP family divalent metal transporter n=1 Tax=Burkholderia gladioli TaxID=28095 RepID=UPI00163E49D1|nr:divalent metal cation transporter [Burkholderia gladioli]MDN7753077.1 divalent metal cation transporter [Burkholderia gladioli]